MRARRSARRLFLVCALLAAAWCGQSWDVQQLTSETAASSCHTSNVDPEDRSAVRVRRMRLSPDLPIGVIPVLAKHPGGEWLIVYREGLIYAVRDLDGEAPPRLYADLTRQVETHTTWETGLVGFAAPRGSGPAYAYVYYTARADTSPIGLAIHLSRVDERNRVLDLASEEILLSFDKDDAHHHAGTLMYGLDGYLHVSIGDNWTQGEEWAANPYSQDRHSLQGSLLRLDVSRAPGYRVPPGNPFVGGDGRGEVYAYGFRNPWKFSFDRETGDLWLADVGGSHREEVNRVLPGRNYGWPLFEGRDCIQPLRCRAPDAEPWDVEPPVADFGRTDMACAIGGFVYRGTVLPSLRGKFLVGDCVSGAIWTVDPEGREPPRLLIQTGTSITTFAEDDNGEIYFADIGAEVYRLEGESPVGECPATGG